MMRSVFTRQDLVLHKYPKRYSRKFLTGGTYDAVLEMSVGILCEQEGTLHLYTRVINSGAVGGNFETSRHLATKGVRR